MRSPRDYQTRAVESVRAAILDGARAPLLVAPTGAGKTYMLCMLADNATQAGKSVAWYAHRRELVTQAARSVERYGMRAGYSGVHRDALIQISSVQGVLARGEAHDADLVILDEAHHFAADDWGRIPAAYPHATIVGATATPERGDGRPLDGLFDRLVVAATPTELLAKNVLTPCDVLDPGRVLKPGQVAQRPVDAWLRHAKGMKSVVFASTVKHAQDIAEEFRRVAGIDVETIDGTMPAGKRDSILRRFATGQLRVIVNVYVLTEGWDCPDVECVILARRFSTPGQFIQATGRGVRAAKGKDRCLLLDLTGASRIHGHPLADREYSLSGEPIRLTGSAGAVYCPVCGAIVAGRCDRCGREAEPAKVEVTGDPLVKFAHLQVDDEATRTKRLAKFMREEIAKGNSWKRALYRYKGTYNGPPPSKIVSAAIRLSKGAA